MRSVVVHAPLDLRVENMPAATGPGPGEVKVSLAAGGICGSDLHYYQHGGFSETLVCEAARFKDRVQLRPAMEVPVSRTMLRAVMNERVALVTFDALSDQRLSGGESIRLHQIRSAMCALIHTAGSRLGCPAT